MSLKGHAQEPTITYEYTLILTLDNEKDLSNADPFSIILTPDRKYLISRSLQRKTEFKVFSLTSEKLISEIPYKGRHWLIQHYFEDNSTVFIALKKGLLKIDLTKQTAEEVGCEYLGKNICSLLAPFDTNAWAWKGNNYDITLYGQYIIRKTENKTYFYYNLNQSSRRPCQL